MLKQVCPVRVRDVYRSEACCIWAKAMRLCFRLAASPGWAQTPVKRLGFTLALVLLLVLFVSQCAITYTHANTYLLRGYPFLRMRRKWVTSLHTCAVCCD